MKGEIMTNTKEKETIIRNYYQQLYANKVSNLEEMDAFLETYKLPKQWNKDQAYLNINKINVYIERKIYRLNHKIKPNFMLYTRDISKTKQTNKKPPESLKNKYEANTCQNKNRFMI